MFFEYEMDLEKGYIAMLENFYLRILMKVCWMSMCPMK